MTPEQKKMVDLFAETYKNSLQEPDDFCDALDSVMEKIQDCDFTEEEKLFWGKHCYEATLSIDAQQNDAQQIAALFKENLIEKVTQEISSEELPRAGFF